MLPDASLARGEVDAHCLCTAYTGLTHAASHDGRMTGHPPPAGDDTFAGDNALNIVGGSFGAQQNRFALRSGQPKCAFIVKDDGAGGCSR